GGSRASQRRLTSSRLASGHGSDLASARRHERAAAYLSIALPTCCARYSSGSAASIHASISAGGIIATHKLPRASFNSSISACGENDDVVNSSPIFALPRRVSNLRINNATTDDPTVFAQFLASTIINGTPGSFQHLDPRAST